MAGTRKSKAQAEAEREAAEREQVIQWATQYSAPIAILEGWNPDTGVWTPESPVGKMLAAINVRAAHISVAARFGGVRNVSQLLARGVEYHAEAPENREYIPVGVRVFTDLVDRVEEAEANAELALTKTVRDAAKDDWKPAMALLERRWANRWRQQQTIFTGEEHDHRAAAVSAVLSDPDVAMQMAELAHRIEDQVQQTDV